jgi:hypothetical protein
MSPNMFHHRHKLNWYSDTLSETRCPTLGERLRVFWEQSAEQTFRPELIEGWRKLHNEELRNLYYSSNTIWVTKSMVQDSGFWRMNSVLSELSKTQHICDENTAWPHMICTHFLYDFIIVICDLAYKYWCKFLWINFDKIWYCESLLGIIKL